jgi:tellurite resistance protein
VGGRGRAGLWPGDGRGVSQRQRAKPGGFCRAARPRISSLSRSAQRFGERPLAQALVASGASHRWARSRSGTRPLGESAEPGLRDALRADRSFEVRQRIERILQKLEKTTKLREWRALEAIEHTRGTEARRFLEALAEGAQAAQLTREARLAVTRLSQHESGR